MSPTIESPSGTPTSSPARPALSAPKRRRRTRVLERTLGLLAVAAMVGAGVLLVRATGSDRPSYRTASATTQTVQAALDGVATVEPVDQAIVGFPAAGTVSTVDVVVGDVVAIGQQLATLDTLELERDLRAKQAALAQAQLVLSVALDGDDPSSLVQGSGQTPMGFASTAVAADTASDVSPEVAAAQQAVLAAQQNADSALADAAAALDSAIAICDTVATADDPAAAVAACQAALVGVVAAQRSVASAQDAVTVAADALDSLLAEWADELESSSGPTTPTTEPVAPARPNRRPVKRRPASADRGRRRRPAEAVPHRRDRRRQPHRGLGGTERRVGSTVTNTPSSEDLIAYQFDVDAAQFGVQAAEQALAQAVIVSPIAGTVTAIDLNVGDDVTAASTTQTIVVEGLGGYEATTTVSINDIADIHVTQKATVVPDGSTEPISGKVVAIAPTPDPASSTTSYRVTIGFNDEVERGERTPQREHRRRLDRHRRGRRRGGGADVGRHAPGQPADGDDHRRPTVWRRRRR